MGWERKETWRGTYFHAKHVVHRCWIGDGCLEGVAKLEAKDLEEEQRSDIFARGA